MSARVERPTGAATSRSLTYEPTTADSPAATPAAGSAQQTGAAQPVDGVASRRNVAPSRAPVSRAVFLGFTGDETSKYWGLVRRGAELTLTWGKSGTRGGSKVVVPPTEEAARVEAERRINKQRAEGYAPAVKGYRLVADPHGPDQLGGFPPGVDERHWPKCGCCKEPMAFLALLTADAERLPLASHAALAVFQCQTKDGASDCDTWEPGGGANAVLLLTAEDLARPALSTAPKGPRSSPEVFRATRQSHVVVADLLPPDDTEDAENAAEPSATAMGPSLESKVGGLPAWVQGESIPHCDCCAKPMRYVAQLDDAHGFNFGDCGAAFVFVCREEQQAKMLWQCC